MRRRRYNNFKSNYYERPYYIYNNNYNDFISYNNNYNDSISYNNNHNDCKIEDLNIIMLDEKASNSIENANFGFEFENSVIIKHTIN